MSSAAIRVSGSVLVVLLTSSFVQAKNLTFDCKTVGKQNSAKYIECLTQQKASQTTFISSKCPPSTCLDQKLQICTTKACTDSKGSTASPVNLFKTHNINVWLKPVGATESEETSGKSATVQGRTLGAITRTTTENTTSIPTTTARNYAAINKTSTASEEKESRMTNYRFFSTSETKRDGSGGIHYHGLEDPDDPSNKNKNLDPLWTPTSIFYNCTARRYNCTGPGLFPDKNDNTMFYKCRWSVRKNKWRAVCFTCNEKFIKCWSNRRRACVPCDDVDSEREYVTEVISQTTSYDCVGYQAFPCSQLGSGLHEHPGDKSIAVLCSNETFQVGEWLGGCLTCNREKMSCFIEGIGQCVDHCTQGKPYDCSHYKIDENQPCKENGQYKFATPYDNTTYFICTPSKDGSGQFYPECRACPRNWYFDWLQRECVGDDEAEEVPEPPQIDARGYLEDLDHESVQPDEPEMPPPGGYDCKPYNDFLFPCHTPGYYSHENDTSIYFSCWPLPSGGFAAVCYTCNKAFRTCFDDKQQACVTVGKNETCGTSVDLRNRTDKGTAKSSRTYSCDGYTEYSFPCMSYSEGYFGKPGDLSVYFRCEDKNGDRIPEYSSCHTCNKETEGCWNANQSKCVDYCEGRLVPNYKILPKALEMSKPVPLAKGRKLTKLKQAEGLPWSEWYHPPYVLSLPKLSYDCFRVSYACVRPGIFVNTMDPSVFFICSRGRRSNDWNVQCKVCPRWTCFDVRLKTCSVNCRRTNDPWRFNYCRDYWTPSCDLIGIG